MRCNFCNEKLERNWKFCPYCGEMIRGMFKFKFPVFSPAKSSLKQVEKMFESIGFPVNIKVQEIPVREMRERQRTAAKPIEKKERTVEETREPETKVIDTPSGMEISIKLPGVKSRKDIIIRKFEESIEIRAYSGKKMYFKVIPVRNRFRLAEENFKDSVLGIKIKK